MAQPLFAFLICFNVLGPPKEKIFESYVGGDCSSQNNDAKRSPRGRALGTLAKAEQSHSKIRNSIPGEDTDYFI